MRIIVCDIECNGLLDTCSKMWCAVTQDITSGETKVFSDYSTSFVDGGTDDFIAYLKTCDKVIGHNWIGYDKEAIRLITGYEYEGETSLIHCCYLSYFTSLVLFQREQEMVLVIVSQRGASGLASLNQNKHNGKSGKSQC